jgi:TolB-like protein/DNA-binding winged helix-turn-helix (wHTH) protein/Tfp pilus assembly protein PilF
MATASQARRIRFAAFEVDLSSSELFKHGIRIKLQDQPFQILTILLERPGELISREELRRRLWTDDTFVDFDAGMNAAIRRLRDALSDSADQPRYIQTLPRRGYRFIGDVATVDGGCNPAVAETHSGHADRGSLDLLNDSIDSIEAVSATVAEVAKSARMQWLVGFGVAVGLATIITIGTVGWRHRLFATHASNGIQSIAVLPLQNLSGDSSQDYFADGMTEALITNLAQIKSLRVISRTSSMHYKGTQEKLPQIAKELNVDAVVEGVVVRSGDRVRIDAQLIRADSDRHTWARSYDRKISDVLSLQADVAQAIATEIEINLTPGEQSRLAAKKRTVDPEVYEAYLKGHYFSSLSRFSKEDLKKSVEYYQEAIQLDPTYAPAYAGLSEEYSEAGIWADTDRPVERAIEAAKKAISLDDSLAEAHWSLAFILYRHMQDWSEAEKEFKRALELNPNDAWAHKRYGDFQDAVGLHDPTCSEYQLAQALDPLNTKFTVALAACIARAGRFEEGVRMMKSIIEMEPENAGLRWALGDTYERKDLFPEALEQYQKGANISGRHQYLLTLMASAYAGWGKPHEAEKLLAEMNQKYGKDGWLSALVYARMGRKEQAIEDLVADSGGKCGPGKCGPGASLFVSEWRFDPLRSDPRFQALLDLYHYPESARRIESAP